jgi:hypothetical protein
MPRSWRALIIAAAVLLGTFSIMTLAAASTDNTRVLHLVLKTVQANELDLGGTGPSQGDQVIFSDDVYRGGKKVGTDGGVFTATRVTSGAPDFQGQITFRLPEGQLTAQGLFNAAQQTLTFAITGGTGAYRDAGGYVTGPNSSSGTVRVTAFVDDLAN